MRVLTDSELNDAIRAKMRNGGPVKFFTTKQQYGDSLETIAFRRAFEGFLPEILAARRPPQNLELICPVNSNWGDWDLTTGFRMWDGVANPAPLRGNGANTPRVGVNSQEDSLPVETFALLAGWTMQEQGAAMQAQAMGLGMSLDTSQVILMRQGFSRKANDLGYFGDNDLKIIGIFNNDTIQKVSLVDSTGTVVTISSASTPAQIRDAMGLFIQRVRNASNRAFECNAVQMCTTAYNYLNRTQNSVASDVTLLGWLRTEFGDVTFSEAEELTKGYQDLHFGATGIVSDDFMIALDTRMPGWAQSQPMPFRLLELTKDGPYAWLLPGMSRVGSVLCPFPAAVQIAENVIGAREVTA